MRRGVLAVSVILSGCVDRRPPPSVSSAADLVVTTAEAAPEPAPPRGDPAPRCPSRLYVEGAPLPADPSDLLFYVNRWNAIPADYPIPRDSLWTPCAGPNPRLATDLVCLPRSYAYGGHEALRAIAFESDAPSDRATTFDGLPVGFAGKIGFKALIDAAREEAGVSILVRSGFRSFHMQEATFLGWVAQEVALGKKREDAWLSVASYSAKAGHSEHQLGTTADLVYKNEMGVVYDGWDAETIAASAPMKWVMANAHRFGIVLTYGRDREGITQYVWEPWHYRFVGVEAAEAIKMCDLTTEELLEAHYRIGPPPTFSALRKRSARR